ncbi:MAG: alpha/beta fold hydrolase [Candidatus Hydrogenedentota bacterium]|nr:MAG: alpha/beta fold hydrolase [Candidatus Hydrogenedentota bacterium]
MAKKKKRNATSSNAPGRPDSSGKRAREKRRTPSNVKAGGVKEGRYGGKKDVAKESIENGSIVSGGGGVAFVGLPPWKVAALGAVALTYLTLFVLWLANVLNHPILGIGAVEWFGRQPAPVAARGNMTWVLAPRLGNQAVKYRLDRPLSTTPFTILKTRSQSKDGSRVLEISYRSDSEKVYGILGVPAGDGPFPALVVCHPSDKPYTTGLHTEDTVKWLAENGILSVAPDYRGWGRSEGKRGNEVRDVLNALESLKRDERVDPKRLGLVGYSMGGGIALRASILDPSLKVTVLYYPQMFGSLEEFREIVAGIDPGRASNGVKNLAVEASKRRADKAEVEYIIRMISPIYHTEVVPGLVAVFHGENDNIVSIKQSRALVQERTRRKLPVEFHSYPMLGHAFANSIENPSREDFKAVLDRAFGLSG